MKRFTEVLCQMYCEKIKKPMAAIVVRPANIYGPFDDFEWATSHVLPALIRKAVERHDPLEVWGDGKDIKDFIYIDDFIDGILLAMEKLQGFKPLNIATGNPVDIKSALKIILCACDYKDAKIVFNNSKPTMIPKRLIDVSLAQKTIGFHAKVSFEEGLTKTVKWYMQYRSGAKKSSKR
jgi:GDP-L-fucose synthase